MGFNLWHSTKFLLNSCRWPGHRLLHIADPSTQSCLMEKLCWNRACSSGNADDQTTGWTAAPRASHTLCEYQLSWLITLIMLTKALHQFYAKSKQHQMAKKKKKVGEVLLLFLCHLSSNIHMDVYALSKETRPGYWELADWYRLVWIPRWLSIFLFFFAGTKETCPSSEFLCQLL